MWKITRINTCRDFQVAELTLENESGKEIILKVGTTTGSLHISAEYGNGNPKGFYTECDGLVVKSALK